MRSADAFMTLMDVSPLMPVIVDHLNCITYTSKKIAQFAHIENPALAVGRPVLDLFRNLDAKLMIGEMLDSTNFTASIKEIEINGETRYFSIMSNKMGGSDAGRFI